MKKRIVSLWVLIVLCVIGSVALVGCGSPQLKDFNEVVFENVSIDYDGQAHTIEVAGAPGEATVTYTNAGPYTEPGTYSITVKITAAGYKDFQKTATLTINKLQFSGIEFEANTLTYDGQAHTISAVNAPDDATVTYTNAGPHTNAGEYTIGVSVSATGYETYNREVVLIIEKADYSSDITFTGARFFADGEEKKIEVEGELPVGTQVVYEQNTATEKGVYNATATLKNPNYNDKTLTATLEIVSVVDQAKKVLDTVMTRPDAWEFMPQAFKASSLAYDQDPSIDFSDFTSVNNIKKKFMGKQMFVLWEGVRGTESLLAKFDMVYAVAETIAAAYQNFINDNPDNFSSWQGEVAGFNIKIVLDGQKTTFLAGNNLFSIELYADSEENVNKGRIQLADNAILNYEMSEDYLKFNTSLSIKGVANIKQVEFIREEDTVSGYFYEYSGVSSAAIKTSAVIAFNENYAVVMSAKRESDDLLVEGYEEVYNAQTGEFLSAEVMESVKVVSYDTHWVNVFDVTGINTIKAISNGSIDPSKNNFDVYVNGANDIFQPEYNKVAFVKTSRHFDIEMKDVVYIVKVVNGGKTEYQEIHTQIPMVFVQKDNVEDFGSEVLDANDNAFSSQPALPTVKIAVAQQMYAPLKTLLDTIKESMTYDELMAQMGSRDPFFSQN